MDQNDELLKIYRLLDLHFGDLHWWPAEDPFEVMVGAILTQNTAWTNVETAIKALRKRGLLTPEALLRMPEEALAEIIRSSGYYHLKAKRLKTFVRFFMDNYSGSVAAMKAEGVDLLRDKLLTVRGVGPETADSILLYACQKPIFVIDAYTRRIFNRHGLIDKSADYDEIQSFFMASLPLDVKLFNQFHALIVFTAKKFCRKRPECADCPLDILKTGREIC